MRNDIFLKEIGRKVKAARKANKLSLPKLSKASGIDMSNLWFVENGRRNPHILTLKAIADVFSIDVKEFLKFAVWQRKRKNPLKKRLKHSTI